MFSNKNFSSFLKLCSVLPALAIMPAVGESPLTDLPEKGGYVVSDTVLDAKSYSYKEPKTIWARPGGSEGDDVMHGDSEATSYHDKDNDFYGGFAFINRGVTLTVNNSEFSNITFVNTQIYKYYQPLYI